MADSDREPDLSPRKSSDADKQEKGSPRREEERRRSRSPRRDRREDDSRRHDRPKHKSGGFKWKDKSRDSDPRRDRDRDSGLNRGYKDHYRPRSRSRSRSAPPPPPQRSTRREGSERSDRRANADGERKRNPDSTVDPPNRAEVKEKKPKPKATPAAVPQEPMIRVTVNDRLGTKVAVPCLPSDSVRQFKMMVAAMIGRQPHEILLKRQGERPFKDQLTLQDYGVSNNVQLDLEVDTGD